MASNIGGVGGAGQPLVPEISAQKDSFPLEALPEELIHRIIHMLDNPRDQQATQLLNNQWESRILTSVKHNEQAHIHKVIELIRKFKISDQDKEKLLVIEKQNTLEDCRSLDQIKDSKKDVERQIVQILKNYPGKLWGDDLNEEETHLINENLRLVAAARYYQEIEEAKNDLPNQYENSEFIIQIYKGLATNGFAMEVLKLIEKKDTLLDKLIYLAKPMLLQECYKALAKDGFAMKAIKLVEEDGSLSTPSKADCLGECYRGLAKDGYAMKAVGLIKKDTFLSPFQKAKALQESYQALARNGSVSKVIDLICNETYLTLQQKEDPLAECYKQMAREGMGKQAIDLIKKDPAISSKENLIKACLDIMHQNTPGVDIVKIAIEEIKNDYDLSNIISNNISRSNYKEIEELIDKIEDPALKRVSYAAFAFWIYDTDLDPGAANLLNRLQQPFREEVIPIFFNKLTHKSDPFSGEVARKLLDDMPKEFYDERALYIFAIDGDFEGVLGALRRISDESQQIKLAQDCATMALVAGDINNFQKIVDAFKLDPKQFG